MKQTVAAYIAKTLEQAGVKRIWGVTGDSLNGLSDSLNRMGTIDWMPTRHEEVAAFAAGAEAQLTGELAVCAGSCGPGNLHLINGLFDCHRNHVPVLAIAAHIPSSEIGSGYFQETHPQELFRECSHYCELVSTPEQIPQVLAVAMRKAVINRGVSVVVLPGDVALKAAPESASSHWYHAPLPTVTPAEEELRSLFATPAISRSCAAAVAPAPTRNWWSSQPKLKPPSSTPCAAKSTWSTTTRTMWA